MKRSPSGDARFRGETSYEAAVRELNAVLVSTSDALSDALPYLTFEWKRESTFVSCDGTSAHSQLAANRVADTPVAADDDWVRALHIVADHAASLGPVESGPLHEDTTVHDTVISAGGFSIQLGSGRATVLSGRTPCRLPDRPRSGALT
jgi:hypothetical protein